MQQFDTNAAATSLTEGTETRLARLQEQVAEMLDREAIRQLPAAYAHFARTRNIDAMLALFTEDGAFDVVNDMGTGAGPRVGIEAIRAYLSDGLARHRPWPFIHGHHVEMRGKDRAEGFVDIELRMGCENNRVTHAGFYRDEYVKQAGVWKFRLRSLSMIPVPTIDAAQ